MVIYTSFIYIIVHTDVCATLMSVTHTDVTDVGSVGPMCGIGGSDTQVSLVLRDTGPSICWGPSDTSDISVPNKLLLYT